MATYHITDIAGLEAISQDMAGDYIIDNDITGNITSICNYLMEDYWFIGTLDGQGHILTLTITPNLDWSEYESGLFLSIGNGENPGTIRNIIFRNCTSDGSYASILGNVDSGVISNIRFENCHVTCQDQGGLILIGAEGVTASEIYTDEDCVLLHNSTEDDAFCGMFCPEMYDSSITESEFHGEIIVESAVGGDIGGIVGDMSGSIVDCASFVNITTPNTYPPLEGRIDVTFDSSIVTGEGWSIYDGDEVVFGGVSIPAELTAGVIYYVLTTDYGETYKVCSTYEDYENQITIEFGSGTGYQYEIGEYQFYIGGITSYLSDETSTIVNCLYAGTITSVASDDNNFICGIGGNWEPNAVITSSYWKNDCGASDADDYPAEAMTFDGDTDTIGNRLEDPYSNIYWGRRIRFTGDLLPAEIDPNVIYTAIHIQDWPIFQQTFQISSTDWNGDPVTFSNGSGDAIPVSDGKNVGTPKTPVEMKLQETYIDWDFVNIWEINVNVDVNSGYPYLFYSFIDTILPDGMIIVLYSQTLTSSYGTAPYTWVVFSGALPDGLSLDGGTGVISGYPTVSGDFSFTIQVTDSNTVSGTKSFLVTIALLTLTSSMFVDLKTELNETDIWNDIRVMLPSYGYTLELVGQQWFRYPINLQARATDGQSINKYGRRTKTLNKHVTANYYAEAYCEGELAQRKEPIPKTELKLLGVDATNIVTALTIKVAGQIAYSYSPAGLNATALIDNFTLDVDLDGIPRLTLNLIDVGPLADGPDPPIPTRQFLHIDDDTVDDTTDLIG